MDYSLIMQEVCDGYTQGLIGKVELMNLVKREIITLEEARAIIKYNGGENIYEYK